MKGRTIHRNKYFLVKETKRFEKFAQQQFKSLVKHLKNYRNSRDTEMLNQIRVDIKKIKAILAVINDSNKGFKAHENFIPLREIFRSAGAIREPHVLTRLLLRHQIEGISDEPLPRNLGK